MSSLGSRSDLEIGDEEDRCCARGIAFVPEHTRQGNDALSSLIDSLVERDATWRDWVDACAMQGSDLRYRQHQDHHDILPSLRCRDGTYQQSRVGWPCPSNHFTQYTTESIEATAFQFQRTCPPSIPHYPLTGMLSTSSHPPHARPIFPQQKHPPPPIL